MKRYWAARSLTSAGILIFSCCLMAHSLAAQGVDESRIRFSGDGGKVPEPAAKIPVGRFPGWRTVRRTSEELKREAESTRSN